MKNNLFFRKNKSLLMITALFLGWFGFVFWLVLPARSELENKFIALEKKKLDNKADDAKLSKLPELKRISGFIDSEKEILDVIFSEEKIIDLVGELEKIAEETGNEINISVANESGRKIENVSVVKDDKKEDIFLKSLPTQNYFEIDITLKGDYNKTLNFIKKINRIKYYNVIKSFEMAMREKDLEKVDRMIGGSGIVTSEPRDEEIAKDILPEDKFFLESKLKVLFYLMGKKDEKK